MRTAILFILSAATAHPQILVPISFSAQHSGYPSDMFIDFESGANGDALSTGNMNKHGSALSCSLGGTTGFMSISTSGSVSMPTPALVSGVSYSGYPNTRSVKYDPDGSTNTQYVQCDYSEQVNVSAGSFYRTTSTTTEALSIVGLNITDGSGNYLVSHWVAGGLHLQTGETCSPSVIPITPNHSYWAAIRWRTGTPTLQDLYVWDTDTWTLTGYCTYSKTAGNATTFSFGRTGSDVTAGVGQWYWDNYLVSLSGLWPLAPHAVVANSPTYDQESGSYISSVTVAISDMVPGATIKYCVDSSGSCTPTTTYSSPVEISTVGVNHLRSQATLTGWTDSGISDVAYTITEMTSPYTSSLCGGAASASQPSCSAGAASVGDMVVAFTSWEGGPTFTSFSTTGCTTGTWTVTTREVNYVKAAIGWALVTGAGTCVTAPTLSAYGNIIDVMSHVVKNVNQTYPNDQVTPLIVTPYQPGTSTDAISTGNLTPNNAGDLLIGFLSDHSSGVATLSVGTNAAFSSRANVPNAGSASRSLLSEDVVISGTTATAAKFTDSRGNLDYIAAGALLVRKP